MRVRFMVGLAVVIAAAPFLSGSAPVVAAGKICLGHLATQTKPAQDGFYYMTPGDDVIVGTSRADTVYGRPGSQGGTDYVCTGGGDDRLTPIIGGVVTIDTGGGNDAVLIPGVGTLIVSTGSGRDYVLTNVSGVTEIDTGSGNDEIDVKHGDETVYAGSGNDHILSSNYGGGSGAKLNAGSGRDLVEDSGIASQIDCGSGNDTYSTTGAPALRSCETAK